MSDRIPGLLEPIQKRLDAATDGPWHWRNTSDVYLMGARTRVVMGFSRMGMQGAQPQFVNENGLFIDAGKENLHTIPDAAFIANAPTDQARLLAAVQAVTALHYEDDQGKCAECTPAPFSAHSVKHPCPTVAAVVAALGGEA